MKTNSLKSMLNDGFSEKFAKYYLSILESEQTSSFFDPKFVNWAHERGFSAQSAMLYDINNENYKDYLSDYDYYKIWPLNSWTRIWVNDKLTLKYMLANSEYGSVMPKYYYYMTQDGLKSLIDNPYKEDLVDVQQFIKLLSEVKVMACKPCNGSASEGFIKLDYLHGKVFANGEEIIVENIEYFLRNHLNYIYTEYIKPTGVFERISKDIHTLRLVTINYADGPKIVGGYLRFSANDLGGGNYKSLDESHAERYNIFSEVNIDTGEFNNAQKVYLGRKEKVDSHPLSKVKICGKIPDFKKLCDIILGIAKRFNTLDYLGFDIGVTIDGFKCMEINTHPGIGYMQMFKSLYSDSDVKEYFYSKITAIDNLSEKDIKLRNKILR